MSEAYYSSVSQMRKAIEAAVNAEVKSQVKDLVTTAIERATEEVAAEMMVRLGECISATIAQVPSGGIEVRIVYRGLK